MKYAAPKIGLFLVVALATWVTGQTKPSTQPAIWKALADGELRLTAPEGWEEIPLEGDHSATYRHPDGHSVVSFRATFQKTPIPVSPSTSLQLGKQILKSIKDDLVKSNANILEEPRLQRDPRYFVRIHDKIQLDRVTRERLHLYRVLGYYLLMVTVDVSDQDAATTKVSFKAGEDLLSGVLLGKRNKPTKKPARK
jgi:hypothetical protein